MRNVCTVEGCDAYVVGRGLCRKHYARMARKGSTGDERKNARPVCSVEGCERPHQAKGLCFAHWKSERARASTRERKQRSPRFCAHCGEPVDPSKRWRGEVSYCSRKCKERQSIADGRNAIAARKSYFKRRYGLTPERVDELAAAGCAICGTHEWNGRHKRPHVDHCHKTGRVRGILCSECNTGLGKFRDDPKLLEDAMNYLLHPVDFTP